MVHKSFKYIAIIAVALTGLFVIVYVTGKIPQNYEAKTLFLSLTPVATATSQSGYEVLKEGVGIGNIVLYNSTAQDIREIYGNQYGEVNHQSASDEVIYEQLGVSFFFRLNSSVVFSIHVQPPFKGITTQGIVLGESTMRDVFAVYGSSDDWYSTSVHETYWVEYPGIQFHVNYKELATPPWVNNEEYLSEKIIRITIE